MDNENRKELLRMLDGIIESDQEAIRNIIDAVCEIQGHLDLIARLHYILNQKSEI